MERIIHATTREEIDAARRAQHAWLVENPDDFGVLEAGEDLAYAEEALLSNGPEAVEPVRGEHPTEGCPECTSRATHVTEAHHVPIE